MSHSQIQGFAPGTRTRMRWILIALAFAVAAVGSLFAFDRDGHTIEAAQAMSTQFVTPDQASTAAGDRAAGDPAAEPLLDDFRPDVDRHAATF